MSYGSQWQKKLTVKILVAQSSNGPKYNKRRNNARYISSAVNQKGLKNGIVENFMRNIHTIACKEVQFQLKSRILDEN